MLTAKQIAAAAADLDAAEKSRKQMRMISLDHPGMSLGDAYAIQKAWVARKVKAGRKIIGHKVGLTSRAMQLALKIDEPDLGVLLDDMVFADGGDVPTHRFIGLRVEAELAFILGRDLKGPDCTLYDVLEATRFVTPALEILDTRIFRADPATGRTRTVMDTVADNAANAGVVIGGRPARPAEIDMRWVAAIVSRNGRIEETGVAAGVLNHPGNSVAWLVSRLHQHGEGLEKDEVILSGSFIRPIEVGAGDTIHADYGPLGSVSCFFK